MVGNDHHRGFTLIELAMVAVVLGLLMGGLLGPLTIQAENNRRHEAQAELEKIGEALLGYAMVTGRLPCPNTDGQGDENREKNRCHGSGNVYHGLVPWKVLGVGRLDPWGNRFAYAVSAVFSDQPLAQPAIAPADMGAITVVNGVDFTPALVLSHGPNGHGAISGHHVRQSLPSSATEKDNGNQDARFVLAEYNDTVAQAFDDQMVWLSPFVLKNRLYQAGQLPRADFAPKP